MYSHAAAGTLAYGDSQSSALKGDLGRCQRGGVALFSLLLIVCCTSTHALSGKLSDTSGKPIAGAYVALMDKSFAPVSSALSEADGSVPLPGSAKEGFLVVQPPASPSKEKLQVFTVHPRIFQYAGEAKFDIKLPPAASIAIEAYDSTGKRMLWEDFEKNGKYGGAQFLYATNVDDEAVPMTQWPIHGEPYTNMTGGPREKGLPGCIVEPGAPVCVNILFWPTKGYGKLLLRADNAGKGYTLAKAGDALLLNLNVELARTAVHDLESHAAEYADASGIAPLASKLQKLPQDAKAAAAIADEVLAEALRLRDELELARAEAALAASRNNHLTVTIDNAKKGDYALTAKQLSRDFLFGVYEGSPYNAKAWEAARKGGFDYATILPAWNWTRSPKAKSGDIDRVFGISQLEKLGYRIKGHGIVWMQGNGILPDFALKLPHDELVSQALEHQQALLDTFKDKFTIVEAMNEPANTNVPGVPAEGMRKLLSSAAENIAKAEKPSLVNSPHEFAFGSQYWLYNLDGTTATTASTFSAFLKDAPLDDIGIIGIQCYPGVHFNAEWGNTQGPCQTPSHLMDTLRRYARFGKNIHITELSFPSSYGSDWYSGYWKEKWTPEIQAEYAQAIYTLAYAEPAIHSITWWDISDAKPSVITGGLIDKGGKPKAAFEKVSSLIEEWQPGSGEEKLTNGAALVNLPGGEYEITVTGPGGFKKTETMHLLEGFTSSLTVDAGG